MTTTKGMSAAEVKCRQDYILAATMYAPEERVRVLGREMIGGEVWFRVRFADGGILMCHPSNLARRAS